jgi:hypothetical protein
MMTQYQFYALAILSIGLMECRKQPLENPHYHSLLKKSPDEIRKEISGKWQIKRSHLEGCGIIAPCWKKDTFYTNNTGDFFYFLSNDTVRRTNYSGNVVKIYEKAEVKKEKNFTSVSNGYSISDDSIYVFRFNPTTPYALIMLEIKNDTLVMDDGWALNYLTRQ